MKKIAFVYALLFFTFSIYSQMHSHDNPFPRVIEVTGSAEMEIVPQEVTVSFNLTEYYTWVDPDNPRKTGPLVPLSKVEDDFVDLLLSNGVTKKHISLSNLGGYWSWYYRNEKLKRKTFNVVFTDITKLNTILREVESKGLQNVKFAKLDHEDLETFRQEVKINALKAAKEKANYLLESVGESVGKLVTVREIEDYYSGYNYRSSEGMAMSNMRMASSGSASDIDNVKKIKLRYKINAKFEIK